uniref:Uncharacterized protein n=1 Tax=Ascaris lumbricoides TaxID=6252 RepID=A0A0M3HG88_ASCLU
MGNSGSRGAPHSPNARRRSSKQRDESASPARFPEYRIRSESLAHTQRQVKLKCSTMHLFFTVEY